MENDEEHIIRQMEVDTQKGMIAIREEEERKKLRDEKKEIDGIYNKYLANRHPQYPIAREKLLIEDSKPVFDPKMYYKAGRMQGAKQPQPAPHKIDTLGKLDKLQESTIRELDFYNLRQEELNKKLEEQQRVLQAVQNDITKRE